MADETKTPPGPPAGDDRTPAQVAAEEQARMLASAPPTVENTMPAPPVDTRPAPSKDNVMYTIALPHNQLPVGPAIMPHPTKSVVDAMGVTLPPLDTEKYDVKQLFLVGGKYVNSDGIAYDQVGVAPAEERLKQQEDIIADLQRQLGEIQAAKSTSGARS